MTGEAPIPNTAEAWLAQRLRHIEDRLDELAAGRPMMSTTQRGGLYVLADTVGDPVWYFGAAGADPDGNTTYGVEGIDKKGDIVFAVVSDREGVVFPHEYHQWIVPTAQSISSGAFVGIAECDLVLVNQDVLTAAGVITTPVGSSAEVRLNWAGQFTAPVVVDPASSRTVIFEWLHPFTVGWGDSTSALQSGLCHWEVRVASGAGPITAYPPRHLTFRNRAFVPFATTTGGGRAA